MNRLLCFKDFEEKKLIIILNSRSQDRKKQFGKKYGPAPENKFSINVTKSNKNKLSNLNDQKLLIPSNSHDNEENHYRKPNKMTSYVNHSNFTPLHTPKHLRNNSIKANDIFGINPLPSIRSPYSSAREPIDPFPNLESWGITNQPQYDETFFNHRYNNSPYLPVYSSSVKKKVINKIYLIIKGLLILSNRT